MTGNGVLTLEFFEPYGPSCRCSFDLEAKPFVGGASADPRAGNSCSSGLNRAETPVEETECR
jgi:hypothetical protein